jgi:hypothetical protein
MVSFTLRPVYTQTNNVKWVGRPCGTHSPSGRCGEERKMAYSHADFSVVSPWNILCIKWAMTPTVYSPAQQISTRSLSYFLTDVYSGFCWKGNWRPWGGRVKENPWGPSNLRGQTDRPAEEFFCVPRYSTRGNDILTVMGYRCVISSYTVCGRIRVIQFDERILEPGKGKEENYYSVSPVSYSCSSSLGPVRYIWRAK